MKIYVIFGSTGEHEDYQDWIVKAFVNKIKADAYANEATIIAQELMKQFDGDRWKITEISRNPLDPEMRIDYTGTCYSVAEVELEK